MRLTSIKNWYKTKQNLDSITWCSVVHILVEDTYLHLNFKLQNLNTKFQFYFLPHLIIKEKPDKFLKMHGTQKKCISIIWITIFDVDNL